MASTSVTSCSLPDKCATTVSGKTAVRKQGKPAVGKSGACPRIVPRVTNILFATLDGMTTASKSRPCIRGPECMKRVEAAMRRQNRWSLSPFTSLCVLTMLVLAGNEGAQSQSQAEARRSVSGVVITDQNEAVPGALITVESPSGKTQAVTDANGNFKLRIPTTQH
jgi:hypothetical protein